MYSEMIARFLPLWEFKTEIITVFYLCLTLALDKPGFGAIIGHNFIWKIEARLTRVAPENTAEHRGGERGCRRGAVRLSDLAVAGPSENIRRTVTVVERYRIVECTSFACHESFTQGLMAFLFCLSLLPRISQQTPAHPSKPRQNRRREVKQNEKDPCTRPCAMHGVRPRRLRQRDL